MNEALRKYLSGAYRHDVLGESGNVPLPTATAELIAEAKAELARINGLRLGANLAQRDFASYQHRRALMALLEKLEP